MSQNNRNLPAADDQPSTPANKDELFKIFLENQTKELEIRSEELVLRKQEDSNAFQYSKEILAKKVEDRNDQRTHEKGLRKMTLLFSSVVIAFLIALIAFALYFDKDSIAEEIIKALVFVTGGAFGGYGYANSKKSKSKSEQN